MPYKLRQAGKYFRIVNTKTNDDVPGLKYKRKGQAEKILSFMLLRERSEARSLSNYGAGRKRRSNNI